MEGRELETQAVIATAAAEGGGGMHPVLVGLKVVGQLAVATGKAVFTAGMGLNKVLKETMILDPPQPTGEAEFPPIEVPVSKELGYKIKLLENTSKALGYDSAHTVVKGIIDQVNDKTFKVLIVGKFGTGKSALLNKLLEREILKTGAGETTKTLAWLWYGEKNKELAWYQDYDYNLHGIQLEEIVNIPENPPVFNVFASVHAEILNHGAILIDTPGLAASSESAALTNKAMESADAVILVVDDNPVEKHDKQLVEKLQKEGKTGKLFVVLNKMDVVDLDEQKDLIEDRIKLFSDMGVRARVFPLSCEVLSAADNGFAKFREALVEYIDKDLQTAKDESVFQRIKNTAAYFSEQCEGAAEYSKIKDEKKRAAIREEALKKIEKAKQDSKAVIYANKAEIRRLENSILVKWEKTLSALKNEVYNKVQKASDLQLNSLNHLFGDVQAEISRFLLNEFSEAEEQIQKSVIKGLNGVQLPMLQKDGQITVNTPDRFGNIISKIDPRFGTFGVLAFTFFTKCHGFFKTVFCIPNLFVIFVLGPFINKLFEQVLKVAGSVNSALFKTKLQEEINNQWPDIDNRVREKISIFFKAISEQVERSGDEAIKTVFDDEHKRIALADSICSGEKAAEIENINKELKIISG